MPKKQPKPVLQKLANRRIYDQSIGAYTTLQRLRQRLIDGERVHIGGRKNRKDKKMIGEDVTLETLAQLIVEDVAQGRVGPDACVQLRVVLLTWQQELQT